MTEIEIELSDEDAEFLQKHLAERGLTMDELAGILVGAELARRSQ